MLSVTSTGLVDQFGQPMNAPAPDPLQAEADALPEEEKQKLCKQLIDTYGFVLTMAKLSKGGKYVASPQALQLIDKLREIVRLIDPELVADLEAQGKAGTLPVSKDVQMRAELQTQLNNGAERCKKKGLREPQAREYLQKIADKFYEREYGQKPKPKVRAADQMFKKLHKPKVKTTPGQSDGTRTETNISF